MSSGFDDSTFNRPNFSHPPSSARKAYTLSRPEVIPPVQIPAQLFQYLRGYQCDGIQFLYDHYVSGVGALLCDDMGLGKTVQVIAFICAVLGKTCTKEDIILTGPKPTLSRGAFLIIAPCSVLYNWLSEIETWSHLKTGVFHRNKKEEVLDKVKRGRLDVVLTTHETAKTKMDDINSISWLAVIADEAHAIKNPSSQITEALNELKVKTRFGLTGTALQNNFIELWSLMNWIKPNCLGSLKEFQAKYERPILQGQKYDCTKRELATAKLKQKSLEGILSHWMLRRTKSLIASQLPQKEEFVVFCPVTPLQATIYSAILQTNDIQELLLSHQPCLCQSGETRINCCHKHHSSTILSLQGVYLALLLKCANHIGLLLPSMFASDKQNEKAMEICEEVFSFHPEFLSLSKNASFLTLADPKFCGKMQALEKLVTHFKEELSKVIVFSDSVRLLNIIENYIVCKGYTYSRLDGGTKIEDRSIIVNKFNTDPSQFIILISKKCGGTGLNVTGANRVVIFDPSWNPATDMQAEDRAFRIGQYRDVKVYRLITEGTIEEMMYLRQVYKQQMTNTTIEGSNERRYFTGVAGDRNQTGELFGISNLLQPLRPQGVSLTLDILKRAELMEAGVKMAVDPLQRPSVKICEEALGNDEVGLEGAKTVIHSGHRAVIGNSRVEEHICRQAVLEMDHNSQQPANVVDKKMENFSEESENINYNSPDFKDANVIVTDELQVSDVNTNEMTIQADSFSACSSASSDNNKLLGHQKSAKMPCQFGYPMTTEFAKTVTDDTTKPEELTLLKRHYEKDDNDIELVTSKVNEPLPKKCCINLEPNSKIYEKDSVQLTKRPNKLCQRVKKDTKSFRQLQYISHDLSSNSECNVSENSTNSTSSGHSDAFKEAVFHPDSPLSLIIEPMKVKRTTPNSAILDDLFQLDDVTDKPTSLISNNTSRVSHDLFHTSCASSHDQTVASNCLCIVSESSRSFSTHIASGPLLEDLFEL